MSQGHRGHWCRLCYNTWWDIGCQGPDPDQHQSLSGCDALSPGMHPNIYKKKKITPDILDKNKNFIQDQISCQAKVCKFTQVTFLTYFNLLDTISRKFDIWYFLSPSVCMILNVIKVLIKIIDQCHHSILNYIKSYTKCRPLWGLYTWILYFASWWYTSCNKFC